MLRCRRPGGGEVGSVADDLKDLILSVFEAALDAQLRAIRRLRQGSEAPPTRPPGKGMSQVDMAFDILKKAGTPLHVAVIIERIQAAFGVAVDRESLVSALTKKVNRGDRFTRPDKNTFALRGERE
jgi:HB1, ASXL, restriction endonuclease HTH domain